MELKMIVGKRSRMEQLTLVRSEWFFRASHLIRARAFWKAYVDGFCDTARQVSERVYYGAPKLSPSKELDKAIRKYLLSRAKWHAGMAAWHTLLPLKLRPYKTLKTKGEMNDAWKAYIDGIGE